MKGYPAYLAKALGLSITDGIVVDDWSELVPPGGSRWAHSIGDLQLPLANYPQRNKPIGENRDPQSAIANRHS